MSRYLIVSKSTWRDKSMEEHLISVLCPRDVHVSLQHQVCSAHIVLAAVFEKLDLEWYTWAC